MKHEHQYSRKAFTLIELLIVVAIIAILAAIAVPNFLEAQVRSKVARVKTDMRSIATAIECYTVDNNRPPIDWYEFAVVLGRQDPTYFGPWAWLTTPIAYITSIPDDPFTLFAQGQGTGGGKDYGKKFAYGDTVWWSSDDPAVGAGYKWFMRSIGPSLVNPTTETAGENWWIENNLRATTPQDRVKFVYDSTNGTKSIGLIARTNKGIYTGQ